MAGRIWAPSTGTTAALKKRDPDRIRFCIHGAQAPNVEGKTGKPINEPNHYKYDTHQEGNKQGDETE